jgi:hypothetical protein
VSDALITSLQANIADLTTSKAKLHAALKQARAEAKEAKDSAAAAAAQLAAMSSERDTLAARAASGPEDLLKQVAELKGQIAARDHRDGFKAAAMAAGVSPTAMDDLYALSGLKPGDDPAKPEDFVAYLTEAKTARPWAFTGESPSASGQTQAGTAGSQGTLALAATQPPPGAGRGAPDHSSTAFKVRKSDLSNGAWMSQHQADVARASAEGRLVIAD